jgi:membrane-bound lytic murein transglycosylase D
VALEEIAASHALPVEVNDRVTRWMGRFVGDQRPTFEQFLSREGLYGDMIRGKLRDRGMPEDLIYLAMIESGFQPLATSSVEATGVWQFMGPTALAYGLRIDDYVDERRDPVRATDAALDYLEELHARFGSWYLAAAAYNAGPGRVSRALRRHGGDLEGDEELYWEIIDHLPRETREYVPRLIAATLLARRADDLGFAGETEDPYRYDRVWVPGGTRLHTVANSLDVPLSRMKDLNPHLIRGATPPGGSYALRVPQGRSAAVVAALAGASSSWLTD